MNRTEAMQKLVSIEPITEREIVKACGWPYGEAVKVLKTLVQSGVISYGHIGTCERIYFKRSAVSALRGIGKDSRMESVRLETDKRNGEGSARNVGRMACVAGEGGAK